MMRIIKLTELLKMPDGTVYMDFEPIVFGNLCVKKGSNGFDIGYENIINEIDTNCDTYYIDLIFSATEDSSISLDLDFDCTGRNGYIESDKDKLFAVYEKKDIEGLIKKLTHSLTV